NIFGQSHNEIGSDVPLVLVLELTGRRHIGDIALLRTAIDPLHERGDLFLRERSIVLEMANAYVLIDVPGWHLASESFLLDCFSPWSCFLIGQQRHRGKRTGTMADLALILQNRRNVFREGDLLRRRLRGECRTPDSHDQYDRYRKDDIAEEPAVPNGPHVEPPGETSCVCEDWFPRS